MTYLYCRCHHFVDLFAQIKVFSVKFNVLSKMSIFYSHTSTVHWSNSKHKCREVESGHHGARLYMIVRQTTKMNCRSGKATSSSLPAPAQKMRIGWKEYSSVTPPSEECFLSALFICFMIVSLFN